MGQHRLQGMVASLTRMPTFRRRFNNLVKNLYVYAIETGKLSWNDIELKTRSKIGRDLEERKIHNLNLQRASKSLPTPGNTEFV